MSFYHYTSLVYIFHNWRQFFTSIQGCLSFVALLVNSAALDLMILTFGTLNLLWSIVIVCFTSICFLQLNQLNRSLAANASFEQFAHYHTRTVKMIFAFDEFFGRQLFVFIITQLPINAFMVMGLATMELDGTSIGMVLNIIAGQVVIGFCVHMLAAMYSTRMHRCSRILARQLSSTNNLQLRKRLRLGFYMQKYHTVNKYGITYGFGGGLMSFESFGKVCLMEYSKLSSNLCLSYSLLYFTVK